MAFHDTTLPSGFDYGSVTGIEHGTIIQESASGHEVRVTRRSQPRHRLQLQKSMLTDAEVAAIKSFVIARRGSLHSFKAQDVRDYTTASDGVTAPTALDVVLATGDGAEDTFQLAKVYAYGLDGEYRRLITLPQSGTVLAALDGVPTSSFTVSGDGQIVFASPPGIGVVITVGFSFYVPVRFDASVDQLMRQGAAAFQRWDVHDLDLVEVLGEVESPERKQHGGSRDFGAVATTVQLAFNDGEFILANPSTAIDMLLPVPTYQPAGRAIFTIFCYVGAAGTIQVRDDAGAALGSPLAAGEWMQLALSRDGSTTTWWVA